MRNLVGVLFAVATFVTVLVIVLWESTELTSPGRLHGAHGASAKLAGTEGCVNCHSSEGRAMAGACAACHEAVATQLASGVGLHGALQPEIATRCGSCHIEHVGEDLALVSDHAFAMAGVPNRDAYDHHHVANFPLSGRHAEIECRSCHENSDVQILDAGKSRFLGLVTECTACHEDPHAREYGNDCASCHGQSKPFDVVAEFVHDARFELSGAHADVGCTKCHDSGSLQARGGAAVRVRGCVDCHADPHRDGGESTRFDGGTDCARCHDTVRFDRPRFAVTDHAAVAFALTGAHASTECRDCHGSGSGPSVWGGQDDVSDSSCRACHESPHRDDFLAGVAADRGVGADQTCAGCHAFDAATFRLPDARLDAREHSLSGFALEAPHDEVACSVCHGSPNQDSFARRFPGRDANRCDDCHRDPHGAQFGGSTCLDCHERAHFLPSSFDTEAHARTRFPLLGAHEATPCSACHPVEGVAPRRFRDTPLACESCHQDPHDGRFDRDPGLREVDGATGCVRCHDTERFQHVDWDAEAHGVWTGYPLHGGHATASCSDCHGDPLRAAPTDCSSCHEDVHHGQFQVAGRTDCARCHAVAGSFQDLVFDHDRDTKFALDANHARVACSACHVERATRSGASVVRYRPLGRECRDCHATERDR